MAIKYNNPILKGFYPDPSICRKGDDYYMVTSSFEFFPGVPIFHSRDLVNWVQIGHCLTRESQLPLHNVRYSMGIFAPAIRYHEKNDCFYMVTTNVTKFGNFFVYADDPAGEWSEPILIEQGGIDPSFFFEEDGTAHFISNAYEGDDPTTGFLMGPIDLETGKFLANPTPVWGGIGESAPEAPHIYKIGDWFYQMIAEGGTELGHMETIARSRDLYGPYEACPYNPIMTHRNRKNHEIQATGHADLIKDTNELWWAVFLGYRETHPYFHHLGRETFLAPVEWVDEWPLINGGRAIEIQMDVDRILNRKQVTLQSRASNYKTDFINGIDLSFVHLRNPEMNNYRVTETGLFLSGNAFTLFDEKNPTFIGFRQKDFDSELKVDFSFSPVANGDEAGVTVFYKHDAHMDIFIIRENDKNHLCFQKAVGDIIHRSAYLPIFEGADIRVLIKSDRLKYYFYAYVNGTEVYLGEGLTRYVSTESHQLGFTGTFYGLYATGNGKQAASEALFKRFSYQGFDL